MPTGVSPQFENLEVPSSLTRLIDRFVGEAMLPPSPKAPDAEAGRAVFSAAAAPPVTSRPSSWRRNAKSRPYTDLLLHDMGLGLADHMAEGEASGREWRTAPLWGIGQALRAGNVGLLHDGRAATCWKPSSGMTARAAQARAHVEQLPAKDRQALIDFIGFALRKQTHDQRSRQPHRLARLLAGESWPHRHRRRISRVFNARYARDIVAPSFKALAGETKKLAQAADDFAAQPSQDGFAALRIAYESVSDAWMQAQFFRLGPLGAQQRFRPVRVLAGGKRPIIDKQLTALLAQCQAGILGSGEIRPSQRRGAGLAGSRTAALWRYRAAGAVVGPEQKARTAVIKAIAHNLDALAQELAADWGEGAERSQDRRGAVHPGSERSRGAALCRGDDRAADRQRPEDRRPRAARTIDKAKPKTAEQLARRPFLEKHQAEPAGLARSGGWQVRLHQSAPSGSGRPEDPRSPRPSTPPWRPSMPRLSRWKPRSPMQRGRKKIGTLLIAGQPCAGHHEPEGAAAIGISLGFNEMDGDGS